jgi:DNA-binding IclR family transcriptional regulator
MLTSIKKALKVLETFSVDQPELGVTEISAIVKWSKGSISKILATLASEGFLEKNPKTKKYRLGLKLADLGSRVLGQHDVRDQASPFMEELAEKTDEIVHLSILDKDQIVYLEKKGRHQTLTVATRVGGRYPAHASAMGKVLLSGLPEKDLGNVLANTPLVKFTPNTITEKPKLLRELDQVREQGFAVDDEESFPGIRCVGAPIRDRNGRIVAAISVTAPAQRMGPQKVSEIAREVVETARLVSERVGLSVLAE